MSKESVLISVILPVYNGENYLAAAIDSVLVQSYDVWELLVVDDGSTDGSDAICDAYAKKDPRIRVDHQPNSGVNTARARGVDNASGDYLVFLDADDTLSSDALKYMLENFSEESGLLICGREEQTLDRGEYLNYLWTGAVAPALWGKMFRASLYKKIDYHIDRRLVMGEDLLLNSIYSLEIRQAKVLPQEVYLVNRNNETSVTKTFKHNWEYEKFYFNIVNELFLSKMKQSEGYGQTELLINKSWLNAMKYSILDGDGINYNDAEFKAIQDYFKDKKTQLGPSEKLIFAVKNPRLYRMILKAYMALRGGRK